MPSLHQLLCLFMRLLLLAGVNRSSGTIEQGVWWTDAQAAGLASYDPDMDGSFTEAAPQRLRSFPSASQGRHPSLTVDHAGKEHGDAGGCIYSRVGPMHCTVIIA